MPKPILGAARRTNPLIWLLAIVCAALAIAVIITGATVFAIYMIYQPRIPIIHVSYAQLLHISYNQYGYLSVQMGINMLAENRNGRAHARISQFAFPILFHSIKIAELRALPFDVPKNSSSVLNYQVETMAVPLDDAGRSEVDRALKGDVIGFNLKGQAKARWRIGIFTSVRFYTHLDCNLQFFAPNGSSIGLNCKSKSG